MDSGLILWFADVLLCNLALKFGKFSPIVGPNEGKAAKVKITVSGLFSLYYDVFGLIILMTFQMCYPCLPIDRPVKCLLLLFSLLFLWQWRVALVRWPSLHWSVSRWPVWRLWCLHRSQGRWNGRGERRMVESWTAAWIWGHQVQNQAIFILLTLNFKPFILCVLYMVSCSVHSNKIFKYEANINKYNL